MLTEAEKKWLEERKSPSYPAPCLRMRGIFDLDQCDCEGCCLHETHYFKGCPLATDYRDAAEFEARVAMKALTRFDTCNDCDGFCFGDCSWDEPSCEAVRLKYARLAVEQEMDE